MTTDNLLAAFSDVPPQDVTVLSGAGVSIEGPSYLPSGLALTRRAFDSFFMPDTLRLVCERHQAVGWYDTSLCPQDSPSSRSVRLPRLETVLGVAARVYGPEAVDQILVDVATAKPNRLHHFFAGHLAAGGGHLTANFDRCIEGAGRARSMRWPESGLLHFHGEVGGKEPLGATLARIEAGFREDVAARFSTLLRKRPVVLVTGYSGSDFFDVNALIAGLPRRSLLDLRVVWLLHSTHTPHLVPLPVPDTDEPAFTLFDLVRQQGAELTVLCGPTDFLLARLARQWGFARVPAPHAPGQDTHMPPIARRRQPEASFLLCHELGLLADATSLLPAVVKRLPPAEIRSVTSAALWEDGRWNKVRRLWWQSKPRSASIRAERIGASLWVQGRLVPALVWLSWHRRRAVGDDRTLLAETEGRVLEHMLRTPELRWWARRFIPTVLGEIGPARQAAGVHRFRTRADLATSLAASLGGQREPHHAATSSEWFGQAGNVLAWISYQHRRLRDAYRDDDSADDLRARYLVLQQHFRSVGSRAGAIRAHLLPGAHRVFTVREVVAGVFSLQYGWWHRVRIVANHTVRRGHWLLRSTVGAEQTIIRSRQWLVGMWRADRR
ncbi:SIR2 family protein [Micromonospora chersina]|uniref:hypothetical protein n=1 Tax=Micromonospora chersina TaxID=47854 RepID=UPI0036770ABF